MDWTVWMMFALTEGMLCATPGPAVLFVVSQALRSGSAGALGSALGILAANALYFALSGTGVGATLAASGRLFTVLKWAGAGYLLYLGGRALLRPQPFPEAGQAATVPESGSRALVLRAFALQLTNPKALLFFVAILPQFLDEGRPVVLQILVLGVTSIVLEFAILSAYGAVAARAGRFAAHPRFAGIISRVSGALLVAAALGLMRL